MKTSLVIVVLMACAISAQFPAGWNYNPFLYYPYTAQQAPVQETAEVAAARATHLAAHASARGSRVIVSQPAPVPVWGQPGAILDTPEVWAAKVEHYRAHSAAAAANGVVSTLPPLQVVNWGVPQPVQDTPEVAAARAAHLAAHAAARGKRSIQDTPDVMAATIEHYRAYNAAAAANGIVAYLPARYANMPWGMPSTGARDSRSSCSPSCSPGRSRSCHCTSSQSNSRPTGPYTRVEPTGCDPGHARSSRC
ncbi:Uncharacterized protein APZ42_016565 [Daphnia magna]|uniref:Cuticle protein n=1 Tax=Daphnia magna TaxID=35525 RepID=A0A165AHK2_9CRUS|nr:Uncharacterized protein APZ42_016565 [Daphnia magna]